MSISIGNVIIDDPVILDEITEALKANGYAETSVRPAG